MGSANGSCRRYWGNGFRFLHFMQREFWFIPSESFLIHKPEVLWDQHWSYHSPRSDHPTLVYEQHRQSTSSRWCNLRSCLGFEFRCFHLDIIRFTRWFTLARYPPTERDSCWAQTILTDQSADFVRGDASRVCCAGRRDVYYSQVTKKMEWR